MWSVALTQNAILYDDLVLKTSATFAKLTTDYYFYFPEQDYENIISVMTKGKSMYQVTLPHVGVLNAVQCKKVTTFPKMKISILDYEYIIDPETYLYPRADLYDDKQVCIFLFAKHDKPYISLPEMFLKGVPIHHLFDDVR